MVAEKGETGFSYWAVAGISWFSMGWGCLSASARHSL